MMVFETFKENIDRYLQTLHSQQWRVGFSGGLDSTVLLHLLHRFNNENPQIRFSCVHVNHGLSQNASNWVHHCQRVCHQLDVSLDVFNVNISPQSGCSLEEQARDARYQIIQDNSEANTVLFLGHHLNDQAETVLQRLSRGAGPTGLSGMKALIKIEQQYRFRPLLNISKLELQEYADRYELTWIEDESNGDSQFDRNFIRHEVFPMLEQRWAKIQNNIVKTAELCAEQQSLIDDIARKYLAESLAKDGQLNLDYLKKHSQDWQSQIIRMWLSEYQLKMPSTQVLRQIVRQAFTAKVDATPTICHDGFLISRFANQLHIYKQVDDLSNLKMSFNIGEKITFPAELGNGELIKATECEGGFYVPESEHVSLSFGGYSRRFRPFDKNVSKPIKQWFKEWGVPPWIRRVIPIFTIGEQVVQVGKVPQKATLVNMEQPLYRVHITNTKINHKQSY